MKRLSVTPLNFPSNTPRSEPRSTGVISASKALALALMVGLIFYSPFGHAEAPNSYVGKEPKQLPDCVQTLDEPRWQSVGGIVNGKAYFRLRRASCGEKQMAWLLEGVGGKYEKIVDAIELPKLRKEESIMNDCDIRGALNPDPTLFVIGVAETWSEGEHGGYDSKAIRAAWRVNQITRKIESVSVAGIACGYSD